MEKSEISAKIKDILTQNLGIDADMLTDEAELFGGDIGLDSIDSLEIIAGIDREFGVSMTGVGKEHFFNVASLTKYVEEHLK
ncbi:MAG: acyl carrier protein [Treponema sp.]|nr:acyl carrier protein [Treponema sp.]